MTQALAPLIEARDQWATRLADTHMRCRHSACAPNPCRPNRSSRNIPVAASRRIPRGLRQIRGGTREWVPCYSAKQKRFGSSLLEAESDFASLNETAERPIGALRHLRRNRPGIRSDALSRNVLELFGRADERCALAAHLRR